MIIDILLLIALGGFTLMAYEDYTRNSVSNRVTAALWILVGLALYAHNSLGSLAVLGMSFGVIFLANEIFFSKFKKMLVAWGDILLVPTMLAFVSLQGTLTLFAWASLLVLFISALWNTMRHGKNVVNVKVPLIYYLYWPLLIATLLSPLS